MEMDYNDEVIQDHSRFPPSPSLSDPDQAPPETPDPQGKLPLKLSF